MFTDVKTFFAKVLKKNLIFYYLFVQNWKFIKQKIEILKEFSINTFHENQ